MNNFLKKRSAPEPCTHFFHDFTRFLARNYELSLKYNLSILKFPRFFFHFCKLFPKIIIELKNMAAKNVDLDEVYTEIFLIFKFSTLFIDFCLCTILLRIFARKCSFMIGRLNLQLRNTNLLYTKIPYFSHRGMYHYD